MQDSETPTKIPAAFANAAGPSYINTIPTASQISIKNGAASFTDGFPPLCFVPLAAGGAGPYGSDFNGLFFQITGGVQWFQAGGPLFYDSAFSTAIGGYPNGAILSQANALGQFWMSTVDNNTSDPDTGGSNWIGLRPQPTTMLTDTGSADVMTVSITPAPASLAALVGIPLIINRGSLVNNGNTTPTLTVNSLAATAVLHSDGNGPMPLSLAGIVEVIFDGIHFQIQSSIRREPFNVLDTGTANAMAITLAPVPASLAALVGVPIQILKSAAANTGTSTLAVNGLTATMVGYTSAIGLGPGDLPASQYLTVIYNGSIFELQSNTFPPGRVLSLASLTDTGSVNAMAVAPEVPMPSPIDGVIISVNPAHSTTSTTVTLAMSGGTAYGVVFPDGGGPVNTIFFGVPIRLMFHAGTSSWWILDKPVQAIQAYFQTGGTSTYTVTGGLHLMWAECQGGGGGGAGDDTSGSGNTGGGGGAGGFVRVVFQVEEGDVITCTVGAGGAGGAATANGVTGSSSSISSSRLSTICACTAGVGGVSIATAAGGGGGTGTIITGIGITAVGGDGSNGVGSSAGYPTGDGGASFYGGGLRAATGAALPGPGAPGSGGGGGAGGAAGSPGTTGTIILWG